MLGQAKEREEECVRTRAASAPQRTAPHLIRAARPASLVPLLQRRGLQLLERKAQNYELAAYPDLTVKDSYWRGSPRSLARQTIDFFVQVLGLSFHDTMREITHS